MCGLFGYIGTRLDIGLVNTLATLAETRGPHAYGLAWLAGDGKLTTFKAPGRITQHRLDLLKVLDAPAFIGHCRLSTSGAAENNTNNQPLTLGNMALAHNGNVYAYRQIYDLHGYVPKSECDSEALLLEIYSAFGTLPERVLHGWQTIGQDSPQAALLLSPAGLAALRHYHPLYHQITPTGVYFCSRPFDDAATLLTEGVVHHFHQEHTP
ncbi:MAG: hypothetical protein JXA21_07000 [Anaerolineae bacterium]|nr:hypothetical protein [Anaerolineae bacterium]